MPLHSLTIFEIQIYYQNENWFIGVYSKDILTKVKDGTQVTNINEFDNIHFENDARCAVSTKVTHFHSSLSVEHIQDIKRLFGNRNIIAKISRIQAFD